MGDFVTVARFNNDMAADQNLSNHFELVVPVQKNVVTDDGKYHNHNHKELQLATQKYSLFLYPLSPNAPFDVNKPFGGNVPIELKSKMFNNELSEHLIDQFSKLAKAKEEEIAEIIDDVSLYFANTTDGQLKFEHNEQLKYIEIGTTNATVRPAVPIILRIQYDGGTTRYIYSTPPSHIKATKRKYK